MSFAVRIGSREKLAWEIGAIHPGHHPPWTRWRKVPLTLAGIGASHRGPDLRRGNVGDWCRRLVPPTVESVGASHRGVGVI